MSAEKMDKQSIAEQFQSGINCAQVVLSQWAEELGYDREEGLRMAAAFGGGMSLGDTCGAVIGALIAIGLKYGNSELNDRKTKETLQGKVSQFQKKFSERCGSTICRELVGFDFSKPGELEKARASGKLMEYCPVLVMEALTLLDEIMYEGNK